MASFDDSITSFRGPLTSFSEPISRFGGRSRVSNTAVLRGNPEIVMGSEKTTPHFGSIFTCTQ
ncbi:MAG: hypothetical protein ACRENE_34010 [Polyangiaceae bacterium]